VTLLSLRGLVRTLRGAGSVFELRVPELELQRGEVLVVAGPSGSGKSTLLDLLALALRPDEAVRFRLDSANVVALWEKGDLDGLAHVRAQSCGYVLQTGGLLPFLTVRENIALPQRIAGREDAMFVATLAERLEIADQLGKRPAQLSMGQRQRAAIARALAHRPRVVLADEPTAAIHPSLAEEIVELLVAAAREAGAALVMATHDRGLVERFALPRLACTTERDGSHTVSTFRPAA
jgi:ABC-type lipoprotein export system ATPase subunit